MSQLLIGALLFGVGCGPAVGSPSESEGGSGSSGDARNSDGSASGAGSTGSATTGAGSSGGGSPTNPTASDGAAPCEVPTHESGPELVIEVVNGFELPIFLAGDSCDQPLRLRTPEQDPVTWDPDCGRPVCPQEVGPWACAVCDCGQVVIELQPGESTSFTWGGEDYGLIETDPACSACDSCWMASRVPDGIYEAGIPFYEGCVDGDDLCDEPAPIQEFVAQFEYPGDVVVIEIQP